MLNWETYLSKKSPEHQSAKFYTTQVDNKNITVVITLLGSSPFNARTSSGMLWEKIKQVIERELVSEDTLKVIDKAMRKARQQLIMLIKNDPDFEEVGIDMHLSILIVDDTTLYLGNIGDNDLYLLRDQTIDLGKLISQKEKLFHTGSGIVSDGDILLISSPNTADAYLETQVTTEFAGNYDQMKIQLDQLSQDFSGLQLLSITQIGESSFEEIQLEESIEESESSITETQEGVRVEEIKKKIIKLWNTSRNTFNQKVKPKVEDIVSKLPLVGREPEVTETHTIKEPTPQMEEVAKQPEKQEGEYSGLYKSYELQKPGNITPTRTSQKSPFFRKVLSKISNLPIDPKKITNIKISRGKKSNNLIKFIVLALIIIIPIFFVSRSIVKNRNQKQFTDELTTKISEIESQVDSLENSTTSDDYNIEAIQKDINTIQNNLSMFEEDGSYDISQVAEEEQQNLSARIDDIRTSLQTIRYEILKIYPVSEDKNLTILFDSLSSSVCGGEENPLDFAIFNNHIALIGEQNPYVCIMTVNSDNSLEQTIIDRDSNNLKDPKAIVAFSRGFYVYDEENGMIEISAWDNGEELKDASTFKIEKLSALSSTSVGSVSEINIYGDPGEESLYFLSTSSKDVDKAQKFDGAFSFPSFYFSSENLSNGTDIIIDGNIYVPSNASSLEQTPHQKILKYRAGDRQTLTLGDTYPDLKNVGKGYTNESDYSAFFLIDKQAEYQRIITFEKPYAELDENGNYRRDSEGNLIWHHQNEFKMINQLQYTGSKEHVFEDLKEVISNEQEDTLYVLDGTKMLKIELDIEDISSESN
jgi:hypothetical protein